MAVIPPPFAHAATPERYRIEAELDPRTGQLTGSAEIDVSVAEGEGELQLWWLVDRVAVSPTAMDELSARWIYPRGLELGSAVLTQVSVDGEDTRAERLVAPEAERRGRDVAGTDLRIRIPRGQARVVHLRLRFRVHLPRRFGRLGRAGGMVSLTAPWYPLVLGQGDPLRVAVDHGLTLTLPAGFEAWAAGAPLPSGEPRAFHAGFVPVLVARRFYVSEWRSADTRVRLISPTRLYRDPPPSAQGMFALHDLAHIDVVEPIQRAVGDGLETFGAVAHAPRPSELTLALVPSRTELAADAPGFVLLSDRIFQVTPIAQLRAFHRRAVIRALFRHWLAPTVDALEPVADRGLGLRLRATLLLDLDDTRRSGHARTPAELLGWAGFHPAVDQLLYAPQVAFVDAYFGAIAERDLFREAPSRARAPTAGGRRLLEHTRDLLPEQRFRALARGLLGMRRGTRELLVRAAGEDADARLDAWLDEPRRPVNYRLGRMRSERLEDGSYRHVVEIIREGAGRLEPVEVEVVDREGNRARGRWEGRGARGQVTLSTPARSRHVSLDPRHRIDQSASVAGGHPLADDTTHLPLRPPLLRAFVLSARASEGVLVGLIDFAMRRRYDLEHSVGVSASSDARSYGGGLRYGQGIGPKRDNNARVGGLSVGVAMARLRPGFGVDGAGGVRSSLRVGAGVNTHRYFLDPREGFALSGSVSLGATHSDAGGFTGTVGLALHANLNIPIGLRGTLVVSGGAAAVFGSPLLSERPGLGGATLLRGYESDELLGDARAYAVVELRGTLLSDLGVDLLNLFWLREVQIVLSTGAGVVVNEVDGRSVVPAAEVGGGVRLHFDYGGVQPGLLGLDLGVPLLRTAANRRVRPPVSLGLVFQQYF